MMKALWAAILAIALAGCTSFAPRNPADAGALQTSLGLAVLRASYTQINSEYAATTRHTALMVSGEVIKSDRYDLAFFKHLGTAPQWTDAKLGEDIVAVGNPASWYEIVVDVTFGGISLWPNRESRGGLVVADRMYDGSGPWPVTPFEALVYSGPDYYRHPVPGGYSGGPVVDMQGRIVGITCGVILQRKIGEYHWGAGDGIAIPSKIVWEEFHRLVSAGQ